ncbi:MAG TPA: DUF1254 domain-containing protein [Gemmatimonadaceae bacterium]|nr:DUF1254 domain-containing protein [Gemmatimonadaceae bacterium]
MRTITRSTVLAAAMLLAAACNAGKDVTQAVQTKDIVKEAYIYGFPMLAFHKAAYELFLDKGGPQYMGEPNHIWSAANVFTWKDTSVVTPNSDTPYSLMLLDLRAEPVVVCLPAIEKGRYYSLQVTDWYTFNIGYLGTRTTGNGGSCALIAGPGWTGETPKGIARTIHSGSTVAVGIIRTQLFGPADLDNVKKIQAKYTLQPLSAFAHTPAPAAVPPLALPKFTADGFKSDFPAFLNVALQFMPVAPEDSALRARMASIGIAPGQPYDYAKLPEARKAEIDVGFAEGYKAIEGAVASAGTDVNGWRISAVFGDRAFYQGDWLKRAAAARAGIFGNNADEAMYPMTKTDTAGKTLDGHTMNYTLTFAKGALPPVNAFWSVTMYDGKTQFLIKNPIDRYLINSPMLPQMKTNADGSVTIYIQHADPGPAKRANWLPAPDGPIYLVLRLYDPTTTPPSILPPGQGTWKPPALAATPVGK